MNGEAVEAFFLLDLQGTEADETRPDKPETGDGGDGGDVIFVVDPGLNTLTDFRHVRKYVAQDGEEGGKRNVLSE